MCRKYKISKKIFIPFSVVCILLFAGLGVGALIIIFKFLALSYVGVFSYLKALLVLLLSLIFLYQYISGWRYVFRDYAFKIDDGKIKLSDETLILDLRHVSEIKIKGDWLLPGYVHFKMKPSHRKFSLSHCIFFISLGLGKAGFNFLHIHGGRSACLKFYKEVCAELNKINLREDILDGLANKSSSSSF